MNPGRVFGALVVLVFVFLLPIHVPAHAPRATGVPDLSDPIVLNQFVPVGISPFGGDPDFPMVLLANRSEESPQFVLIILDARNGKETWSIGGDTPVFYVLFADRTTIQQAFLDHGFAVRGEPSGEFIAAGPGEAEKLLAQLREGYLRCRGLAYRDLRT